MTRLTKDSSKICACCGLKFSPRNPRKLYCSNSCSMKAYRQRIGFYKNRNLSARNARIFELRSEGCTLDEIARRYGISLQRVHQILKSKPDGKEMV
jgi:DNA-binding CsgD family transcriptional regulator